MSSYPAEYLAVREAAPLRAQLDPQLDPAEKRLSDAVEAEWLRREARRINDERETGHVPTLDFSPGPDFIAQDLGPEFPVVVEKLARAGHNVGMAAQFKAGKTTFHVNLARSLVEGTEFLGRLEVPNPQTVAFVNAEVTEADMQDIFRAVGIEPSARPRLFVANCRGRLPRLHVPARRLELAKALFDVAAQAVIVDCLRPLMAACSLNENDNSDMSRLLSWLDEIKEEAGISTLWLVHHTGRAVLPEGLEHARGATAFDDWADMRVLLTRDDQGRRFVRSEGRMPGLEEQSLRFEPESRRLTLDGRSRKEARQGDLTDRVVKAVRRNPGISSTALYQALGVHREDAVEAVGAAIEARLIHRHPGPKRAQHHFPGVGQPDGSSCSCSSRSNGSESFQEGGNDCE